MENKLKILLLEDQEEDVELITRLLRKEGWNFESKQVDTRDEFIDAIKSYHPDVILSDHSLPQFNSTEALKLCRHFNVSVPFILVTGNVSEEFAVTCLKHGAWDYILKANLSRLPSSIKGALNQYKLEISRKKAELELRLQNEDLIQINREIDRFVYSVSHNLKAPLKSLL